MSRSPKSSSSRWTVPSFFSSSFSNKRTASTTRPTRRAVTTRTEDSLKEESPTPAKEDAATPAAKAGAATPAKKEETGPWVLLRDRNGRRFLWNNTTGQWTYDGITIHAPSAPAVGGLGYSYYGLHQQRQQQQQQHIFSYVQPSVGYGYYPPPSPYGAVQHHPWQQQPPAPMGATVPRMIRATTRHRPDLLMSCF